MSSRQAPCCLRWLQRFLGLLLVSGLAACSAPAPSVEQVAQQRTLEERTPQLQATASSGLSARAAAPHAASTLGTQWGEGRESFTQLIQASRVTPDRPNAVGQLRYSDERSILQALGKYGQRQLNVLLAQGEVELRVVNGYGQVLRIFSTSGAGDYYVAGSEGDDYELVYTNRSQRNYEVVTTVDGLDVLSGQPGSMRNAGYLLRPGERLVIDGFRKNDREVAAFRFPGKARAYASNTPAGDARNIGVIGTALFEVRLLAPDPVRQPRATPQGNSQEPQAFPADRGNYAPPPLYGR